MIHVIKIPKILWHYLFKDRTWEQGDPAPMFPSESSLTQWTQVGISDIYKQTHTGMTYQQKQLICLEKVYNRRIFYIGCTYKRTIGFSEFKQTRNVSFRITIIESTFLPNLTHKTKYRYMTWCGQLPNQCRTFCPLGLFVPWDILSLGRFVPGTLWLRTFCLGTFCPWDILSLGRFIPGTLWLRTFCPWDVLSLGRFVTGTFCLFTIFVFSSSRKNDQPKVIQSQHVLHRILHKQFTWLAIS